MGNKYSSMSYKLVKNLIFYIYHKYWVKYNYYILYIIYYQVIYIYKRKKHISKRMIGIFWLVVKSKIIYKFLIKHDKIVVISKAMISQETILEIKVIKMMKLITLF